MTSITYSDYLSQTTRINNYAFYSSGDNIIFEFTPALESAIFNILPLYVPTSIINGFQNVSSISTYNISSSALDKLFYFNSQDFSNNSQNISTIEPTIQYGVNTQFSGFNFSYSNSNIISGEINLANVPLKLDYISYLSNAITGGYNLAGLFSNDLELYAGVENLDNNFNTLLNSNIQQLVPNTIFTDLTGYHNNLFLENASSYNPYVLSCKNLVDGLLYTASVNRRQTFFNDVAVQSGHNTYNIFWIPFHVGDKISIVLNYIPQNGNGSPVVGPNPVYTRSYKIVLNCVY